MRNIFPWSRALSNCFITQFLHLILIRSTVKRIKIIFYNSFPHFLFLYWSGTKLNAHPSHSAAFMYIWGLPLTSNKFQLPWFSFNSLDLHFSFHWRQFCNRGFLQQALVSGQWSNDDVIFGFFAAKHFSFRHYCLCYVWHLKIYAVFAHLRGCSSRKLVMSGV